MVMAGNHYSYKKSTPVGLVVILTIIILIGIIFLLNYFNIVNFSVNPNTLQKSAGESPLLLGPTMQSSQTERGVISFEGYSNGNRIFTTSNADMIKTQVSHSGKSNFFVHIDDQNEQKEEILVNVIGPYSGVKYIKLNPGSHYLKVIADGSWSVRMELP